MTADTRTPACSCGSPELLPARNPEALRTCPACGTAVLDFDAVYRLNTRGLWEIDDDATRRLFATTTMVTELWHARKAALADDADYANMLGAIITASEADLIDISDCSTVGECVGVYARFLLASHDPARYSTFADDSTFRDYRSETEQ